MTSEGARRHRERIAAGREPLRRAAGRLGAAGLARPTPAGWTAKEVLAHIAFWEEAVVPVVVGMFRQQPLPPDWQFGSGDLGLAPGEWPAAEVHNAREAAWARGRSADEVLARWDRAHAGLLALIDSLTEAEAAAHAAYLGEIDAHYRDHASELRDLLDERAS